MYSLGKFKQQLSLDDQMFQKGEREQSAFLPTPKSLGQALGLGGAGRGEQGSSGTGRGAERSPAELNCAEPARPGHVRGAGNTPALSREGESDKDSCGGERSQEAKNLEKVWGLGFSPPVEKKKSHLWGLLKGPPCWIN